MVDFRRPDHICIWFQAATYNQTDIIQMWLYCNDVIHSVHKYITLKQVDILIIII